MSSPLERAFAEAAGPDPGFCTTCQGPMTYLEIPAEVVIEVVGEEGPEQPAEDPLCPECGRAVDQQGRSVLAFSLETGVYRRPKLVVQVPALGERVRSP